MVAAAQRLLPSDRAPSTGTVPALCVAVPHSLPGQAGTCAGARESPRGRGLLHGLQEQYRSAFTSPWASQDLDDDDIARFGEALDYHEYTWVRELINKHLGEPTLTPAPLER